MKLATSCEVALVNRMQQINSNTTRALRPMMILSVLAMLVSACTESSLPTATGKGDIRGINAIAASPALSFLIEERTIGVISYKNQNSGRYDDLEYNFNFDLVFPGDTDATRIATAALDLQADTDHMLAITGSLSTPSIVQWEQPLRTWEGNETVVSVAFGHLAASAGEVDAYIAAAGVAPSAGQARASFAFGGFVPGIELPAGDYVISITPKGDPNTIIHQTPSITLSPATSYLVGIFDPDAAHTSPIGVRVMFGSNNSLDVPDVNSRPSVRLVNASIDAGNIDMFFNSDFSAPFFGDTAFAGVTARSETLCCTVNLTFTAAGNQGATLLDTTTIYNVSGKHTVVFAGTSPDYFLSNFPDNPQGVDISGKLRLLHESTTRPLVDVYIFKSGEDINDLLPTFFLLGLNTATDYRGIAEGTYEIAVTPTGEKLIVGSISGFVVAKGDVAEFAILDTPDPNIVQLLQLPD